MEKQTNNQETIYTSGRAPDDILIWIKAFLTDRKAQNMAAGTIEFYKKKLMTFARFCSLREIKNISELTPDLLRTFMLELGETHNPGGQHQHYRSVKAFLYWYERETEPENWKNPIRKVRAPRVGVEPLQPVNLEDVRLLMDTCDKNTLVGMRDQALLYVLLDTGARASEVCSMDKTDFDLVSGELIIRQGKGRKSRTVFLGQKSRRALRVYLRSRQDDHAALWLSKFGERLTYWGLDEMLKRRSKLAGIDKPELHAFRRAFALNMLRAGVDVYSLQHLMGHADLQVLRRYLAETTDDLRAAHAKGGPVDRLLK